MPPFILIRIRNFQNTESLKSIKSISLISYPASQFTLGHISSPKLKGFCPLWSGTLGGQQWVNEIARQRKLREAGEPGKGTSSSLRSITPQSWQGRKRKGLSSAQSLSEHCQVMGTWAFVYFNSSWPFHFQPSTTTTITTPTFTQSSVPQYTIQLIKCLLLSDMHILDLSLFAYTQITYLDRIFVRPTYFTQSLAFLQQMANLIHCVWIYYSTQNVISKFLISK